MTKWSWGKGHFTTLGVNQFGQARPWGATGGCSAFEAVLVVALGRLAVVDVDVRAVVDGMAAALA